MLRGKSRKYEPLEVLLEEVKEVLATVVMCSNVMLRFVLRNVFRGDERGNCTEPRMPRHVVLTLAPRNVLGEMKE